MANRSGECPICGRHVRHENLALHVESCLQRSAEKPARATTATHDKKRASTGDGDAGNWPTNKRPHTSQANSSSTHTSHRGTTTASAKSNANGHVVTGSTAASATAKSMAPLAERMRPDTLADLVGQDELLGQGKLLSTLIQTDRVPNMILWGPPGCGKTTLARVISKRTAARFVSLSGASSNAAAVRTAIDRARSEQQLLRRRTILFVDEIHRFNKAQLDMFLPAVEDGTITLIGATTENPSFEINNALLSRCRVYTLDKHSVGSILEILRRALRCPNGLLRASTTDDSSPDTAQGAVAPPTLVADDDAIQYVAEQCGGDARIALNCLEMAVQTAPSPSAASDGENTDTNVIRLTKEHVQHCFAHRQTLFYDKHADFHYDLISAFHKSVRGSDANATLYWLARMLEGGENPLYIARRMIRIASEDVGLAAPELLPHAVATYQAAYFIGMPECDVVLAQCATMLARAPKSVEVYKAYKRVKQSIQSLKGAAAPDVPLHLRNAPTQLMRTLGYGKEYKYNPDYTAEEVADQTYLPTEMVGTDFFIDGLDDP